MPGQELRFRRRLQRTEEPAKNKFTIILVVATAAVIVPALVYTAIHPQDVRSTVTEIARHMPTPVKDIRIAVVASKSTPTPLPSPTATAVRKPTPAPNSSKAASPSRLAHAAHLKRVHALAAAAGHAKKIASSGQTADVPPSTTSGNADTAPTAAPTGVLTSAATPATVAEAAAQSQPVADATPVYAPEIVVDARFTREVHPDYPDVAKEQGVQGTAVVLATIGPNGKVISTKIDQSTGNKLLDAAALSAARASGFEPPRINGKPATETYRLVYTFSL